MTPQERQLVDDLFDRLARLENAPRDARSRACNRRRASRARRTQSIRWCRRCWCRMRRSSAPMPASANSPARMPSRPRGGGFLDSMRQALTGRSAATSVPSVRPASQPNPIRAGTAAALLPRLRQRQSPGGSFLGTAAASAAGVIGGALLLNSISSMFGHHGGSAFAAVPPPGSPWDNSAAGSDLARDAGFNDIGRDARGARSPPGFSTATMLQT